MKIDFESLVNVFFMFAGKYFKGYRTIIIAVLTFIVGLWQWITGSGLFGFLCESSDSFQALTVFCDIDSTKFYAIILTVIGIIQALLRKVTDTGVGEIGVSNMAVGNRRPNWIMITILILAIFAFVFIAIPFILSYWL